MDFINKVLNLLIVFAVVTLAGSFFYINDQKQKSIAAQRAKELKESQVKDVQSMVNSHLQEVELANQVEKLKMEKALYEARQRVRAELEATVRKENQQNMNIPREKQIWKDDQAKPSAKVEIAPRPVQPQPTVKFTSPDDSSGQEIDISKLSPEEKKEYKRQYIENARKGGYQIELSDDMQVIKSTPIRKPSQQNDTVNTPQTD